MTGCIKRLKLFYFAAYLSSCFSCSLTKSQNLCYCQLYTRYFLTCLPLFSLKALITAWREEKEISKCKISLTVASHGNHKVWLVFSNFSFPKRPEICVLLKKGYIMCGWKMRVHARLLGRPTYVVAEKM